MNTNEKTSRIAIPEAIYLHLKKKMKEDNGDYRTVGEYVLHQLNELAIVSSENECLAKQNDKLRYINSKATKERYQAATQVAAAEARVSGLERIVDNLQAERSKLIEEKKALEADKEQLSLNERKLQGEKEQLCRKLQVCIYEYDELKKLYDHKETFRGKIKNLFA